MHARTLVGFTAEPMAVRMRYGVASTIDRRDVVHDRCCASGRVLAVASAWRMSRRWSDHVGMDVDAGQRVRVVV